jgi:hypothetical protein
LPIDIQQKLEGKAELLDTEDCMFSRRPFAMSGGSPATTRAYVDWHAPVCRALRAACGSVDEVSPETFTP